MKINELDRRKIREKIAKEFKTLGYDGKSLEEKIFRLKNIYACVIATLLAKGAEKLAKDLVPYYAYLSNLDEYFLKKNFKEIMKNYQGGD